MANADYRVLTNADFRVGELHIESWGKWDVFHGVFFMCLMHCVRICLNNGVVGAKEIRPGEAPEDVLSALKKEMGV